MDEWHSGFYIFETNILPVFAKKNIFEEKLLI
ncbi:hypothetical protein PSM36_1143 [Proteiniphilum saccharofermentans]|uniref:Uncharacterized protein n=1 Tax=Proteiniphilum saccharofermentans TaxID=1642647 RepID=A0A1R3T3V3_9BACT|nr:hypothetical protein PSM36_1143 [Proteiniphilum saccharofermentans]